MKIGIVGLGLIGGSLALDLRSIGHTILAVSRRQETCEQAIARHIVDDASTDLRLMTDADVVFLCIPLGAIDSTVEQLIPHLSFNTVLTDVGSVKGSVVKTVAPRWQNFVGGHPMAGIAESGLEAALPKLFVDRPYVLTPIESTPLAAVELVADIARSLQSRVYQCNPDDHDRAVAWISHLPVMISASLIATCMGEPDLVALNLAQKLASSGFRDTSRVGGGNPELGVMMAKYNKEAVLRSLHAYRQQVDQIIQQIEQERWNELADRLAQTRQDRPQFL
ncbi:MAG: prephenate/arogenate dehydrogenase [Cyanobacteria bacterium CRU_2_1]|nr:prephenate/arogenate dehydrogenase [Cyanobacteria bacterium RU_5_0]NJR62523.1 prephenate/arogenate dehydrogenase [Cyanobacteria bacterium CRU_2_1]